MTSLKLVTKVGRDPLVVGLSHSATSLKLHSSLNLESRKLLSTLNKMGATGAGDEVLKVADESFGIIVVTGLGETRSNFDHEVLRRAAGAASRALAGNISASFALPHSDLAGLAAIGEGAALGSYGFHQFRVSSKAKHPAPVSKISIHTPLTPSTAAKKAIKRAEILARYTTLVRDLVNTPASHLTPDSFSQIMKKRALPLGLKVEIMNHVALKVKGYGGITSVGQGSANPPRLLRVSYSPPRAKRRYAFVGKGITFDTGGLNLKPGLGMEAMKSDMGGAAAVIAAAMTIAELKLPIAIDAWAPLAENMVSDTATHPGDIVYIYGGKTVEVLNPDAEGRLVLADGLVRAAEFAKKEGGLDGIIDVATLTGAQGIAIGKRVSATMTNDAEIQSTFLRAADLSGESFWPMPLPEELRASIDSPVADLANIGERMGGMLVAGLFLREFIEPGLAWLHLDIASPAYNEGEPFGYTPIGGTGVALRSLVTFSELATSQA